MLNATVINAGDDAFLPRLTVHFPHTIHYVRVHTEEKTVSCDIIQEVNNTVGVACGVVGLLLLAQSQLNISILLDVSHNSTPGDIIIQVISSSDNFEKEELLGDNSARLVLPLKYEVDLSIHGYVSPTSFMFGEEAEDYSPVDCYSERFNYTYKVLNSGPSCSVDTVVEILLPKILTPHPHRLLRLLDWQTSQGMCSLSDRTISVRGDCDVPHASFIQQMVFFFSPTATRTLFCGRVDPVCERLSCRLGNLEAGRVATIHLESSLNPAVLLQAPGRHGIMKLESTAFLSSPSEELHTVLMKERPEAQVLLEALFSQKPSFRLRVVLIVVSLVLGLLILSALIYCLWKAGFFKRELQKKQMKRDSWDYVPKLGPRESFS